MKPRRVALFVQWTHSGGSIERRNRNQGRGPAVALIGTGTMALSQISYYPTNGFGVGRMGGYAERIHFIGIGEMG